MVNKTSEYERVVLARFEINGVGWHVTDWGGDGVEIVEERKNGQEDCHMTATVVKDKDGQWVFEYESISEYYSQEMANAVLDHVRQHGPPPMEWCAA